jgi:hypothetical protein
MEGLGLKYQVQMLALPTADVWSGATGDDTAILDIFEPCTVVGFAAVVTTLINSTVPVVVALDRRVLTASDTGRVEVARLSIPDTTAVGKVVYKLIDPVDLNVGDQLIAELITAATTAGAGRYGALIRPRDEVMANQSDAVASA